MRAYLTAHGTDPDAIEQDIFHDICIMWTDGLIGNRGILEVLGCLTGAVYNYMRSEGQKAMKLQDIIPRAYDYLYPPLTEEEKKKQVNESLLNFMRTNPDAPKKLFEG